MIIHNASFMLPTHRKEEFLRRFRAEAVRRFDYDGPNGPLNPRLSELRETLEISAQEAGATTIAFQVEFNTIDEANRWHSDHFNLFAAEFERVFAPDIYIFCSLFETLPV